MLRCSKFRQDEYKFDVQGKHITSDRPCLRTAEIGPNGERADVRDHGGYLGGFLT